MNGTAGSRAAKDLSVIIESVSKISGPLLKLQEPGSLEIRVLGPYLAAFSGSLSAMRRIIRLWIGTCRLLRRLCSLGIHLSVADIVLDLVI